MNKENKKPEILEEGFFGSLFQLHFLNQMFGGGAEGWDPEQDKFLAAQEQLPGLKSLMADYDNDQEKCARDPKCRSALGRIMSDMPDEVKDATREAFQKDAADQLEETETSLLAMVETLRDARGKMITTEPFKSLDDDKKKKALAVYDKVGGASIRQLGTIWQNLLTVIERNKDKLPPDLAQKINAQEFQGEFQQAADWASAGLEEEQIATNIGGPRYAGTVKGPRAPTGPASTLPVGTDYGLEEATPPEEAPEKGNWEKEIFKSVSLAMEELATDVKTLSGYMTAEEGVFGLDREASSQYAERLNGLINSIDDALYKRLPNMIARVTGLDKRSPAEIGPAFDPNRMSKEDKIKKVRELIKTIDVYQSRGNDEAVEASLKAIATIDEKLAAQVAKKYNIQLKEITIAPDKGPDIDNLPINVTSTVNLQPDSTLRSSLSETQKKKFYESLGDFS